MNKTIGNGVYTRMRINGLPDDVDGDTVDMDDEMNHL
jgi:hypothetical protein